MKYLDLRQKMPEMVFTLLDAAKYFPEEEPSLIKIQLARFVKRKLLTRLKRGLYVFEPSKIDELALAGILYQPSYISLESALFYYGIIPDVPQRMTSVTTTTTKKIKTSIGLYSYAKIEPRLYFGFTVIKTGKIPAFFFLAEKEKALLDYFYLRRIKKIEPFRFNLTGLEKIKYRRYMAFYPAWVDRIL